MSTTSSATLVSQKWWLNLTCLILLTTISTTSSSLITSETSLSYTTTPQCSSFLPGSSPKHRIFNKSPLKQLDSGYFANNGNHIFTHNDSRSYNLPPHTLNLLSFRPKIIHETQTQGLFKVEAGLRLLGGTNLKATIFRLSGFWSEASGKLCMVGSGKENSKQGNLLEVGVVFKLNNLQNSSNISGLVFGTLESLSSDKNDLGYFEKVPILLLPQLNYNFTLVPEESDNHSPSHQFPQGLPLSSMPRKSVCNLIRHAYYFFAIKPPSIIMDSDFLSKFIYFSDIQCSEDEKKLKLLVQFHNDSRDTYYGSFNPKRSLIGEGWWDEKKNRLSIVACRLSLIGLDSVDRAHVGDCSTRLTLTYPATRSIRDTRSILGQIWSQKAANETGYFVPIQFDHVDQDSTAKISDLEYEYTEIEKARKLCPMKKNAKRSTDYPDVNSYNMRFDMSVRNSKGKSIGWGYSSPQFVNDQVYEPDPYSSYPSSSSFENPVFGITMNSTRSSFNMSYMMSIQTFSQMGSGDGISPFSDSSSSLNGMILVSAEGIYDSETGNLCMIGCREIESKNLTTSEADSKDCEILVSFQFPPTKSNKQGGYISGSIESRREKGNPLYFERLDLVSTTFGTMEASRSIWRMDMELILVLISTTLACVSVLFQIFHARKNPKTLPLISLFMLFILTLGHMIPLILNFEALFMSKTNRATIYLYPSKWVEAHEVIIRLVIMVAFLLQFRLLQLSLSAKVGVENGKKQMWVVEMKATLVSLPVYAAGILVALLVNRKKTNNEVAMTSSSPLWRDLNSYGGMILDGFLLPQIILNLFENSKGKSLSSLFYFGTTLVRLLPHGYDLYRGHSYSARPNQNIYIYADPSEDFYSSTWDVISLLGGLFFAGVIYFQQCFGARFMLPRRFQDCGIYERVPITSEA